MVGDKVGRHGAAEAQDGGCDDHGRGRLDRVDDGAHRQGQDELSQEDHAENGSMLLLHCK